MDVSTLLFNFRLAGEKRLSWLAIGPDGIIEEMGTGIEMPDAEEVVDCGGALLMPGAIDCHVHFRDPGLTHKADMRSESRAALAGGVTSIMDMPNTKPATVTVDLWRQKCEMAKEKCLCNYAFFIGATADNLAELEAADYTQVPGVKLFMGSSTGNMLVDNAEAIENIFRNVDAIVAVHAEDQTIIDGLAAKVRAAYPNGNVPVRLHSSIRSAEACYRATARAVDLARKCHRRLHICHITTDLELLMLEQGHISQKLITSEVSPHHLLWTAADYATQGARIKMNPAVKTEHDRESLLAAVRSGLIDMVATDHAPHLLSEKEGDAFNAVSGAPMVQFSLPVMLGLVGEEVAQRAMCEAPAEVYRIEGRGRIAPGCFADLALVREVEPYTVEDADVISKCGWTPLAGRQLRHRVEAVWVNGRQMVAAGELLDDAPSAAKPLKFYR